MTRSLVLSLRTQNYVIAGRLLGFSPAKSLLVDIAPNIVGPILVLGLRAFAENRVHLVLRHKLSHDRGCFSRV